MELCRGDALVQCEAEAGVHLAAAGGGDGEDAAVELLRDPVFFQCNVKDGCAECAAEMGTALAPVEAGLGEAAAEIVRDVHVDAERGESAVAFRSERVGVFTGC